LTRLPLWCSDVVGCKSLIYCLGAFCTICCTGCCFFWCRSWVVLHVSCCAVFCLLYTFSGSSLLFYVFCMWRHSSVGTTFCELCTFCEYGLVGCLAIGAFLLWNLEFPSFSLDLCLFWNRCILFFSGLRIWRMGCSHCSTFCPAFCSA
jgi:hypothetical protein